jgi:glycosyltransferase involved in cell wall biosynthesis
MHLISAMSLGGAEMVVLEHVRHAGATVEPLVCAINHGGWTLEESKRLGARTWALEKRGGRIQCIRRLVEIMRSERVHVVNGHNPSGGFYAVLAGRLARVPVIIRTEHSVSHPGRFATIYASVVEPGLTAATDRVICVCEAVRQSQIDRMRWARARFVTVPNGISDVSDRSSGAVVRGELGLTSDARIALSVASLTPAKAQNVLLDAFAEALRSVAAAHLLIAGDGPLRPALEAQARSLGLADRVRFLGVRNDVSRLLAAADVYVLSSAREGLSMSLLEAMRAGKAAVVTNVGGNGEAVSHGDTGVVVAPGSPSALAEGLVMILSDPDRAVEWGTAARRRWEATYTAEHMATETEKIYRSELLRRRGSP